MMGQCFRHGGAAADVVARSPQRLLNLRLPRAFNQQIPDFEDRQASLQERKEFLIEDQKLFQAPRFPSE